MRHNLIIAQLLFTILFFGFFPAVIAQLRLPHILSDHMVLQRDTMVQLWGWGKAGSTVEIKASWHAEITKTIVDAGGGWNISVQTGKAGGPHTIRFSSGDDSLSLKDILLGDVWLCSGQSNMEWGGEQNLKQIIDELPNLKDTNIRLLQVPRYASAYPQEDIHSQWRTLSDTTLKPFSAIGYFIAKELRKELNIPIGIINSSWGGTSAEVWTASEVIHQDRLLIEAAGKQSAVHYRPHQVASLWNSMIYPLHNFALSGVYWYQGESNVQTWSTYDLLMQKMISSWRLAWGQDFPFYFVQIAPFAYNSSLPLAALLREQQQRTSKAIFNTGMVVVTDLVDNINDIHPTKKKEVADRLAALALNDHYKRYEQKDYKSPIFRDFEIRGTSVHVNFDYLSNGLYVKGDTISDLYIAGQDKIFVPAQGMIKGNTLVVTSKQISKPVAVRFGFSETAMPNLFNKNGLPVGPFRTDDWSFE